jgi:hypothetical protein
MLVYFCQMTVLLDIDGVMVPAKGWKSPELRGDGFPAFSISAINGLKKILSSTNASLVLTTSHKKRFSADSWKRIFANRGINAEISTLDDHGNKLSRKEEVLNWLKDHQGESIVIIDDDMSLNDLPAKFKNVLVLTSPLVGLTEPAAEEAIRILQRHV